MKVTLRPLIEADLGPLSSRERDEPPAVFDDFGFKGPGTMRQRFEIDGFLPENHETGRLAALADGVLAGVVSWNTVRYGPNEPSKAFNVGMVLLPTHRARGVGPLAIGALCRYLFDHFAVNRIECQTDVRNVAAQKAVERAGFTREGMARGAQFRAGTYHDLMTYSVLRSDLTASAPT